MTLRHRPVHTPCRSRKTKIVIFNLRNVDDFTDSNQSAEAELAGIVIVKTLAVTNAVVVPRRYTLKLRGNWKSAVPILTMNISVRRTLTHTVTWQSTATPGTACLPPPKLQRCARRNEGRFCGIFGRTATGSGRWSTLIELWPPAPAQRYSSRPHFGSPADA